MAEDADEQGRIRNDEDAGSECARSLQLLWCQWQLHGDPEILEILEVRNVQDAEPARSKRKAALSEVSAHLELLCIQAPFHKGHMARATKDGLKSRMRENRTSGSVRGSDTPSHYNPIQ